MIEFIRENIKDFNASPNTFKTNRPNTTEIKEFLRQRFIRKLQDENFKHRILEEFANQNYKKSSIEIIANKEMLYKNDVELLIQTEIFMQISRQINQTELRNFTLEYIEKLIDNKPMFRFIQNKLSKILQKALFVASIDGFSSNVLHINAGIMTANAGDSAQFLFIARAILAGFNASNVDVRSSRYDAIVDYENTLLRVQIKGISDNKISFKDRDRGGQGIDYTHARNRGKRITSEDCDIFVAVDKQVGICYLIPMSYVDTLSDEEVKAINVENLKDYKENWGIIAQVAESKGG